jgi:hypothetical protein
LVTATIMPTSTKNTIAICIHTHIGDIHPAYLAAASTA